MNRDTAERIEYLMKELKRLEEIKDTTEKEGEHWWSFLTPDTQRWDKGGLMLPDLLRKKFVIAVDESIQEIKKEIKEL